jgi:predicted nucleic acid-binding protein
MGLIIDTGVFIVWERKGRAIDFSPWQDYGDTAVSVVTASELLVGIHRADEEARRKNRSAFVESVLAQLPILEFTTEVARVHAALFAELSTRGDMINAHDLIIAATAKYHDSAVLTTNVSDFARVPDLEVIELKT